MSTYFWTTGGLLFTLLLLILSSCDVQDITTSDNMTIEYLTENEKVFIDNVGELHNYLLKNISEKYKDEIPYLLGSREGLERMVDIMIVEAKTSELWSLPQDEAFVNRDEVITTVINIFTGNIEEINNFPRYSEFLLFNLDNISEWNKKYPTLIAYKSDLPRISSVIQASSPQTVQRIMLNIAQASQILWKDKNLVSAYASDGLVNQVKGSNSIHFTNLIINSDDNDDKKASEYFCNMMLIVADAEGGAIGSVVGGPFGTLIGGALASAVFVHTSSNAGVCFAD